MPIGLTGSYVQKSPETCLEIMNTFTQWKDGSIQIYVMCIRGKIPVIYVFLEPPLKIPVVLHFPVVMSLSDSAVSAVHDPSG